MNNDEKKIALSIGVATSLLGLILISTCSACDERAIAERQITEKAIVSLVDKGVNPICARYAIKGGFLSDAIKEKCKERDSQLDAASPRNP